MLTLDLNGAWRMRPADDPVFLPASVPGSVYADYLAAGRLEDPFWRDNEDAAYRLMDQDFLYERTFTPDEALLASPHIEIVFEGLDTLCDVALNGVSLFSADNMHRTWVADVRPHLLPGENRLAVCFHSPTRYCAEAYASRPIGGSTDAIPGFSHLRKAHCMFGWDWGPRLPDAGIWRPVYLRAWSAVRLEEVYVTQRHAPGRVDLDVRVRLQSDGPAVPVSATLTAPDGMRLTAGGLCLDETHLALAIEQPELWWPHGYGGQPLYTLEVQAQEGGEVADSRRLRLGLRTLTMVRTPDEYGEKFATCVNGVEVFAMGADYIPEDNLLCRVTPERTRRLLEDCVAANFNCVRVWGGGYYPDDWFYDACDELGLMVWQDAMFACALYDLTPEFARNVKAELRDNVRRLRHHASLALWCANNEMEQLVERNDYGNTPKLTADYIRLYEYLEPELLRQEDPQTFFWPSSPSSGGGFDDPNDPNRGDVHYWDVWHGNKPFSDYRNYFFRYASEFGFQSFPCLKTVASFTLPQDRNVFSRIMERHQRNGAANGKIMNYLSQTFLYPKDFDNLLYASQLLQAEAIRYGVEHWRRNRGRCMGAIYWQLNDCWPVASWASIDYYGRWKALHYAARRFFAPVMISAQEEGEMTQRASVNDFFRETDMEQSVTLSVANETREPVSGVVRWALRDADGRVLRQGQWDVTVPALQSLWLPKLDFRDADLFRHYVSYALETGGQTVSEGTALFTLPKHFHFRNPHLSCRVEGDDLVVSAQAYARSVEIDCPDSDMVLSDNYFDLSAGERRVHILRGAPGTLRLRSVYDISEVHDET